MVCARNGESMQHTRTAPYPPMHAYRTYMAIVSPHIHTRVRARALTIGGLRRRTGLDWVGLWSNVPTFRIAEQRVAPCNTLCEPSTSEAHEKGRYRKRTHTHSDHARQLGATLLRALICARVRGGNLPGLSGGRCACGSGSWACARSGRLHRLQRLGGLRVAIQGCDIPRRAAANPLGDTAQYDGPRRSLGADMR